MKIKLNSGKRTKSVCGCSKLIHRDVISHT